MAESGRGSAGAPPRAYHQLPQQFMEPEAMAAALGGGYAGAPSAVAPRQTSPRAPSPRFQAEVAVSVSPFVLYLLLADISPLPCTRQRVAQHVE